ncbi:hypothetical protein MMC30_002737 [Trapelia coarctata]|nr:hypothetical protein [Trapelia coarctata]
MPYYTQADWAQVYVLVRGMHAAMMTRLETLRAIHQAFPYFKPNISQLRTQMILWGLAQQGYPGRPVRQGTMRHKNGRLKSPSELPASEVKRILGVSDGGWRHLTRLMASICAELNVGLKSETHPDEWARALARVKNDHVEIHATWDAAVTEAEKEAIINAINIKMRAVTKMM